MVTVDMRSHKQIDMAVQYLLNVFLDGRLKTPTIHHNSVLRAIIFYKTDNITVANANIKRTEKALHKQKNCKQ